MHSNAGTWKTDKGDVLRLLTIEELRDIPNGTELVSIFGDTKVKGVDYLDEDTRFFYTMYGVPH